MPAVHFALLVLVVLPFAAANAFCGMPLEGVPTSSVPHWPVLAPPTTVSAPFIVYVTNGTTTGSIVTVSCTDTNCAAAPVVTSQTGLRGATPISANEGLYPCIALSGPSSLPVYGFGDQTSNNYYWDACIDANCTSISRSAYLAVVNLNSMALSSTPNSLPITTIYQTVIGNVGEVSTLTCYLSSCTTLNNYQKTLNDDAAAFADPIQLASVIASDQSLVMAFIRNGNLTVAKCSDGSCIGAKTVTALPYPASKNCRLAMMLSPPPVSLPLIVYCDSDEYMRVLICDDSACTTSRITNAPAVFVGKEPLQASARRYGGVQLNIAMQPCPTPHPFITFASYYTGALYAYTCSDTNCSSGSLRMLIDSGVSFSDMTVFPIGHPLAAIPMIVYSRFDGNNYVLERMYCLDGTCNECAMNVPVQPTALTNLCGQTISNPPAYPPPQTAAPTTPAPTPTPSATPPSATPSATPSTVATSAPPATTQPVVTGPLGPCSVTNNCGPLPTADWPLLCCDGTWIVDANATASKPNRTIQLFTNGSVFWDGDFSYKENDTCTIFIDPSLFFRKRQSQEALLKVDGDAFISGPLDIVINTSPTQGSVQATLPIVQTVSQSGNISGEFQTPIPVALTFPGNECSEASATQVKSADGSTLSVVVSVTRKCKGGHKGLSTGQKVAIGVTVGVVGAALIVVLVVLLVVKPRWAPKLGLGGRNSVRHSKVDKW